MSKAKLKTAVTLMSFLLFFFECTADTGCIMNIDEFNETIYVTLNGTVTDQGTTYPNYINGILNNVNNPSACPTYDYSSVVVTGSSGSCAINGIRKSTYMLATFTPLACPIDELSGLSLICSGLIGIFLIRKRQNRHWSPAQRLKE
jgi:hypothetical protein